MYKINIEEDEKLLTMQQVYSITKAVGGIVLQKPVPS
jgi:hypothetical protein